MNFKKFTLSFILSGIVMCLLAYVWHMVYPGESLYANPDFYGAQGDINRAEPLIQYILLGYLFLAVFMAYTYPKGYEGGSLLSEGFKFGAIIGLVWVIPHGIVLYGVQGLTSGMAIIYDGLWHVVEQGIGGIVIAYIYGAVTTASSSTSENSSSTASTPQPATYTADPVSADTSAEDTPAESSPEEN